MSESLRKPRRLGVGVAPDGRGALRVVFVFGDAFFEHARRPTAPLWEILDEALSEGFAAALAVRAIEDPARSGLRALERPPVFAPPFDMNRPFKILALGRSYRAHALELGNAPVQRPLVFSKFAECAVGAGATVTIPDDAEGKMDHEAELAFVLGADAANLAAGEGRSKIAGFFAANDLTLRVVQSKAKAAGHPWLRAKNFPGAFPVGPWITPASAVAKPESLEIRCTVNGVERQRESVGAMTWDVGRVVEEMSRLWPLRRGDVISTGTPKGVAGLSPGDVCEIGIANDETSLGELVTRIGET